MRHPTLALALLLAAAVSVHAQTPSPVTAFNPRPLVPTRAQLLALARDTGVTVDPGSADSLNRAGFALYEKKDYRRAAPFFRAATDVDPTFLFPHFNLACVLSLGGEGLSGEGEQELLYHLHRVLEIDPNRVASVRNDTDLAAAWQRVRGLATLVSAYERPVEWELGAQGLSRVVGQNAFLVSGIYCTPPGSVLGGNKVVATPSPDGRWYAFLVAVEAKGGGREYEVRVTSAAGRIRAVGSPFEDTLPILYEDTGMTFSSDGRRFVAATQTGLWLLDLRTDRVTRLTTPDSGYTDLPLEWEGTELRFRRGTIVEFSFAGSEWSVDTVTGHAATVSGGRTWRGEYTGGPD